VKAAVVRTKGRSAAVLAISFATVLLRASPVSASPPYPVELQEALDLSYVPACTLCHGEATAADAGPADTLFAQSMIARGLRAAESEDAGTIDPSLATALAAMKKDGVDSDGDGAQDLDELSWGGDPNHYDGPPASDVSAPAYGCGMARGATGGSLLFAAWIVVVLARRRFSSAQRRA
jgi:hypothetical protein